MENMKCKSNNIKSILKPCTQIYIFMISEKVRPKLCNYNVHPLGNWRQQHGLLSSYGRDYYLYSLLILSESKRKRQDSSEAKNDSTVCTWIIIVCLRQVIIMRILWDVISINNKETTIIYQFLGIKVSLCSEEFINAAARNFWNMELHSS